MTLVELQHENVENRGGRIITYLVVLGLRLVEGRMHAILDRIKSIQYPLALI